MTEIGTRRGFLTGLLVAATVPLIASPPLVRASSLMQIRGDVLRDHRWIADYFFGTDSWGIRADWVKGAHGPLPIPRFASPIPEPVMRMLDRHYADQLKQLKSTDAQIGTQLYLSLHAGVYSPDPWLSGNQAQIEASVKNMILNDKRHGTTPWQG